MSFLKEALNATVLAEAGRGEALKLKDAEQQEAERQKKLRLKQLLVDRIVEINNLLEAPPLRHIKGRVEELTGFHLNPLPLHANHSLPERREPLETLSAEERSICEQLGWQASLRWPYLNKSTNFDENPSAVGELNIELWGKEGTVNVKCSRLERMLNIRGAAVSLNKPLDEIKDTSLIDNALISAISNPLPHRELEQDETSSRRYLG